MLTDPGANRASRCTRVFHRRLVYRSIRLHAAWRLSSRRVMCTMDAVNLSATRRQHPILIADPVRSIHSSSSDNGSWYTLD
jgi:hypothetical protein